MQFYKQLSLKKRTKAFSVCQCIGIGMITHLVGGWSRCLMYHCDIDWLSAGRMSSVNSLVRLCVYLSVSCVDPCR